jgi:MFS transporter, FSR family, fosmidomycin resistance protein
MLGIVVALAVGLLMPAPKLGHAQIPETGKGKQAGKGRGGFSLLFAIGVLDSAVRMGFLTFLPFLLKEKGASLPDVGFALALVFIGGAAGKFACGWLGARLGVLCTVVATEAGTAAAIVAVLVSPLVLSLLVLPLLGVMLNGTSSVLYGTVPELAPPDGADRAFALFYTGTIGSGAIAPVLFGVLGDIAGAHWAAAGTAATAAMTLPLALAPQLQPEVRIGSMAR